MKIYWRVMFFGFCLRHYGVAFFRAHMGWKGHVPRLSRCKRRGATFVMGGYFCSIEDYLKDYLKEV